MRPNITGFDWKDLNGKYVLLTVEPHPFSKNHMALFAYDEIEDENYMIQVIDIEDYLLTDNKD